MLFNETRQHNINIFNKTISSIGQDHSNLQEQISKLIIILIAMTICCFLNQYLLYLMLNILLMVLSTADKKWWLIYKD